MDGVVARALEDTRILVQGGVGGLLVENFGDVPFFPERVPPETIAAMAITVREVVRISPVPVGVNVLRNDAGAALAVAAAAGARFIRVNVHTGMMYTDQGPLPGRAHRTLRTRQGLAPSVSILADILVKHATPPPGLTLEVAARETWSRGQADGLVLTGRETGMPADPEALSTLRKSLPADSKVWVGSGVTSETVAGLLRQADGIIVGSALREGGVAGSPVDPGRVRSFMDAANGR